MAVDKVQVIINGVTTTLELNESTGLYEGDVVAPSKSSYNQSKKYYPVTIQAMDDAGNSSQKNDTDSVIGGDLRLTVKEITKPVITVVSPGDDSHITDNAPTITWKVTDNDSGIDPETIGIIVDSGNQIKDEITKNIITGGYQCSYKVPPALSDGSHTFKFNVSDFDGNKATERTLNIVVDTIPPNLIVDSPQNNLVTNNKIVTLSGSTNDATSSPVELSYILNNGSQVKLEVGTNGAFSTVLTLANGVNTITVTAKDKAGRTSSVTRTVKLDTAAPVISEARLSPNPATTESIVHVSVRVTD